MENIKLLAFIAVLVIGVQATTDEAWLQFKTKHGKTYRDLREERVRYNIFKSNLKIIEEHNARYRDGQETYFLKVTKFADITQKEFEEHLMRSYQAAPRLEGKPWRSRNHSHIPDSFDWREKGAVRHVKDQGQCGSCWVFGAIAHLEGQLAIKHHKHIVLSEQNLMDCASHNDPCDGGSRMRAFNYAADHGIQAEEDYGPYLVRKEECNFDETLSVLKVKETHRLDLDEEELKEAVVTLGPISVGLDARGFNLYGGGIYNPKHCGQYYLTHALVVVGYGSSKGHDYWIVKNSWGDDWGEDGYVNLIRNNDNKCGIVTEVYHAEIY